MGIRPEKLVNYFLLPDDVAMDYLFSVPMNLGFTEVVTAAGGSRDRFAETEKSIHPLTADRICVEWE
jgi:hypothetical protein